MHVCIGVCAGHPTCAFAGSVTLGLKCPVALQKHRQGGSLIQANGSTRRREVAAAAAAAAPRSCQAPYPLPTPPAAASCHMQPVDLPPPPHCPMYADMCGPLFEVWRPPGGLPCYCTVAGPVSLVCCSCRVVVLSQGGGGHTL